MKKTIVLAVATSLMLSLGGCGKSAADKAAEEAKETLKVATHAFENGEYDRALEKLSEIAGVDGSDVAKEAEELKEKIRDKLEQQSSVPGLTVPEEKVPESASAAEDSGEPEPAPETESEDVAAQDLLSQSECEEKVKGETGATDLKLVKNNGSAYVFDCYSGEDYMGTVEINAQTGELIYQ